MLQEYNPKNENIFIHVNGELLPRKEAKVSVFDSIVQNGDGVWEGLRVYPKGMTYVVSQCKLKRHRFQYMG